MVFKHDGSDYNVTIDAAGPVFDEDLEYSRQLCEENFGTQQINQNMGLFHVRRYGNIPSPPMGDVTAFYSDVLGCGRYSIHFEDEDDNEVYVYLDLTDVNWATGPDNSFRNILFEEDITNTRVKVYISLDSKTSTQLVDCGYYEENSIIRYWELVRNHGGTWSQYARDRGYFSIDPAYVGPDPNGVSNTDQIPYGDHGNDTLDVDVYVKEDIVIPDGKSLVVTTDPDAINSPLVEETKFLFYDQTGLTIEDGGTFESTNSSPFGVVDYYCYTSTDKGAWRGIVADPGSTIDMGVSTVTDAEVGITLDNPADANLLVCGIADARDIGLWIKNCYTAGPVINTCSITRTGDYSGNFRTRNVRFSRVPRESFRP